MPDALSGRLARVKYYPTGFAGTGTEVARAKTESLKIGNEYIDITSKDDDGIKALMDDIASKSWELSCSGILGDDAQHVTLSGLALNAGRGTALHYFSYDISGFGEFRGRWAIKSFDFGAPEGESQTFEMSMESTGAVSFVAAS